MNGMREIWSKCQPNLGQNPAKLKKIPTVKFNGILCYGENVQRLKLSEIFKDKIYMIPLY